MACPRTKAPETQIYDINHRSGANSVPRVRTVVRGERASRSIVNRTTVLWSIWMVASLILAGSGSWSVWHKYGVANSTNREALTEYMIALADVRAACMDSTPIKRKETNINSGVV
jgi:hypothetical protein